MKAFKPAKDLPMVVSFDGEVLEVFRLSESIRTHISLIEKLELKTDKKGKHTLDIRQVNVYSLGEYAVDEDAVSKVNRLIAEVQKAKAEFSFE